MSDWYYALNNEQKGPVSETEVKAQLAAGKLTPASLVWKDGMDNWAPAAQVPAFAAREPIAPGTFAKLSPVPEVVVPAHEGVNNPESVKPVTLASLFGTGEALEVDAEDAENNKMFGIISYLLVMWWVPLVLAKDSPYAKYHANQGLILFILWVVIGVFNEIVDGILGMLRVTSLEWVFSLLYIPVIYLLVVGIINAAAGKCVPLPVIGKFKLIK